MEQVMSEKYIQSAAAKRFVDSNSVSEFKNELKRFFFGSSGNLVHGF